MTTQSTEELTTEQTEREALFCHTDLSHPVMKILFDLPSDDDKTEQVN